MYSVQFRVRYSDVDERSVVNNARYFNYFEEGRMALLDDLLERFGADFRGRVIVAHAECDYLASLRLRDHVEVQTGIGRIGSKSFDVRYLVRNQHGTMMARGLTTQVRFDYDAGTSLPLDDDQKKALNHYPFIDQE